MIYESEVHLGKDGTVDLTTTVIEKVSYLNETVARQAIGRERFWGGLESRIGCPGIVLGAFGIADLAARAVGPERIASFTKGPADLSQVLIATIFTGLCFYLTVDGIRKERLAQAKETALKQLH